MSASTPARKSRCPRCGSWHDPDSAEGLCPRCLAALNLGSETELPASEDALAEPTAAPPRRPPAPSRAEIARHFPQLEILECLGRGGMGIVYRARQPQLNRLVALKILAPEKEREAGFAERFAGEAQALARLNHPNVVTIYDFGKVNGLYYLLMEYVDGVSLRQLLQARKITPEEALAIVPKICEALQYAHEHGVVHRDIKPENVLVSREGQVKIADFGIAKILEGEAPGRPQITQSQQVIGTPHYMAPEQVEHPQRVDHRADIYSLGVVFYEMLTGELPLGKFPPPSSLMRGVQVDVRLDEVVLRALEKEPARRYQHASQVKTDVETILSQSPRATPPIGSQDRTVELASNARRQKFTLWYGFIVCLIGLPVGIVMNLPYVWGLGIAGILVGAQKLDLIRRFNDDRATGSLAIHVRRRQRRLWYGFIVSLVGLPAGILMSLPLVWGLSLSGMIVSAHQLDLLGRWLRDDDALSRARETRERRTAAGD